MSHRTNTQSNTVISFMLHGFRFYIQSILWGLKILSRVKMLQKYYKIPVKPSNINKVVACSCFYKINKV